MDIARRCAEVLGDDEQAHRMNNLFATIQQALPALPRDGRVIAIDMTRSHKQPKRRVSLWFGIRCGSDRVFAHLAEDIEVRWALSVGFLGVSYLLPVLGKYGRHDLAEQILLSEAYPVGCIVRQWRYHRVGTLGWMDCRARAARTRHE